MKQITILLALTLVCSFAFADANKTKLEELRTGHIEAMNYFGHGYLNARSDDTTMLYLAYGKNGMASVCFAKDIATGFTTIDGRNFYWVVENQKDSVKMTVKIEKNRSIHSASFRIVQTEDEFSIKVLNKDRKIKCNWFCILLKAAPCIGECEKDWKCYTKCAPKAFEQCCEY